MKYEQWFSAVAEIIYDLTAVHYDDHLVARQLYEKGLEADDAAHEICDTSLGTHTE